MASDNGIKDELLALIPSLRTFAMALTRRRDLADDLVQEALIRAWEHQDQFIPGTSLRAWMFTILRHRFITLYWRQKREVRACEDFRAIRSYQVPQQAGVAALHDFEEALNRLPSGQREALVLLTVSGFSIEEVAGISGVAVGTIKSRVSRARAKLREHAFDEPEFAYCTALDNDRHAAMHLR